MRLKWIFAVAWLLNSAGAGAQMSIYVDAENGNDAGDGKTLTTAFRSIERARNEVRAAQSKWTGDATVYLRGGTYLLDKTLELNEKDSGRDGYKVIWTSYRNEKPVVSSAMKVTGWALHDKGRNIYKAVLSRKVDTRQFYVNGERALRARSIRGLLNEVTDSLGCTTTDLSLARWKNITDAELVYREIWTNPRCGIAKVEVKDKLLYVRLKRPGLDNARNKGITSIRTSWYVENAYEILNEPGEWYLDRTGAVSGKPYTIYYIPQVWENMETAETVVPVLENLITAKGASVDEPLQNIVFKGIDFEYTTWLRPNSDRGHSDAQNNVIRENVTKDGEFVADGSALTFRFAKNIGVEKCRFVHLGASGLTALAGCQQMTVEGCSFHDISGVGLQMGNYKNWRDKDSENGYLPSDVRLVLKDNRIVNNWFNLCGVEYRSATALAISFPKNNLIAHNEIYNMPYSGMHLGWGWNTIPQSANEGNHICFNKVQNTMVELADGGAIYTLGPGGDSTRHNYIENNYLNRVMWGQGMYFDNGSSHYIARNNVVTNVDDYNAKVNSRSNHIQVYNLYSNKHKNLLDTAKCPVVRLDSNIIISPKNSAVVNRIKKNAGLEKAFQQARMIVTDKHIYEAEEAELEGSAYATAGIGTKVYGYSGMGFVSGMQDKEGSAVVFTINVSKPGKYWTMLRYGSDKGNFIGVDFLVNGKKEELLLTKQAAGRNNWESESLPVVLKKGKNTIRIRTQKTGSSVLFLDYLTVWPQQ